VLCVLGVFTWAENSSAADAFSTSCANILMKIAENSAVGVSPIGVSKVLDGPQMFGSVVVNPRITGAENSSAADTFSERCANILVKIAENSAVDVSPTRVSKKVLDGPKMFGSVAVHPYITVTERYSDNIYLATKNKQHDSITTIVPAIQLVLPIRRHTLTLTGTVTINKYADKVTEDTTNWVVNGAGDFNFGSRVNLKISDSYQDNHEPRSQSATSAMERFKNNKASASLSSVLGDDSKFQLDYSNDNSKFKNSGFRNRDTNTAAAYAYYRIMPKTAVFAEYELTNVYYPDKSNGMNLDNQSHSVLLGVYWTLSAKSKGTVKSGYQYKKYDDSSQASSKGNVTSVDITHNFSGYNSVTLVGSRSINETSLLGTRYSVTTSVNSGFTHKFNDRLSSGLTVSLSNEEFSDVAPGDTVKRNDKVLQIGSNVRYSFRRWLDSSLTYSWREKDSNNDLYDSIENNVSATLNASF